MPEENNPSSENLVPGTEIIRCIRFMQEQRGFSQKQDERSERTHEIQFQNSPEN